MRIGLYPGTFDPVTNGHTDIIKRALKLVDRIVIGVAQNDDKGPLFSTDERVEMVRDFLAATTAEELAEPRTNPWASHHQETVLSCLHTILEEEWEHHRYAVRDLDVIASTPVT